MKTSEVYFVQWVVGGPVKIGWARDVSRRVRSFQTASPIDLVVLDTLPGGADLEAILHAAAQDFWLRGEWFRASLAFRERVRERMGLPQLLNKMRVDDQDWSKAVSGNVRPIQRMRHGYPRRPSGERFANLTRRGNGFIYVQRRDGGVLTLVSMKEKEWERAAEFRDVYLRSHEP